MPYTVASIAGAQHTQIEKDIAALSTGVPMVWLNARWLPSEQILPSLSLGTKEIRDASKAWEYFQTALSAVFPREVPSTGVIDLEIAELATDGAVEGCSILLVKCDHMLPIGTSIKARGGVFEVLTHAKDVAEAAGLDVQASSAALVSQTARADFSNRTVVVGSTGNLAYSVARMALALGFQSEVHISADATPFKKKRLKDIGANVIEHSGDYSVAVAAARASAAVNRSAYLVDDERSERLFLGYSHGGVQIAQQFAEMGRIVDAHHPLVVYLPCGVGGAPGGLTLGLKTQFGDDVICVFVEPVQSACFTVQLMVGADKPISVYDIGLNNQTLADGLAVPAASAFSASLAEHLLDGCVTVSEDDMVRWTGWLNERNLPIEPSAASAVGAVAPFIAACRHAAAPRLRAVASENATHLVWSTGRSTPDTLDLLKGHGELAHRS